MPSLDDAIKTIHDMILNRFGEAGQASASAVVAFEFGTPIPVSALQQSPSDPVVLSPARALELISVMANVVPDLRDSFFERGLRTVDGQYDVLLKGAEPTGNTQLDLFAAIKADALRKFDVDLGSVEGPNRFHPCNPTPANWYDPTVNDNWSHFHVTSGDQPRDQPGNRLRAEFDPRLLKWRSACGTSACLRQPYNAIDVPSAGIWC
jgi:hypothetical protein